MFLSFSLPIVPQSVSPNAAADKETRRLGTTGKTPPSLPSICSFCFLQLPGGNTEDHCNPLYKVATIPNIPAWPPLNLAGAWDTFEERPFGFLSWMTSNNSLWASVASSVKWAQEQTHLRVVGRTQCSRQKKMPGTEQALNKHYSGNYRSRNIYDS